MMYEFVDTLQTCHPESPLPSEAMSFNGVFLENEVEGYRTLYVSGRESLAPELETYDTGARAGASLKRRHFPVRTITVGYQLLSKTPQDFRRAYNRLSQILNVKEAKLSFSDEPDKYFIGTLSSIGDVDPGKNNITAEMEFTCLDPFKYSVEEKRYPLAELTRMIYEGSQQCYPKLRWTIKGNVGYVGVFKNDASTIIQIGNPKETQMDVNTFAAGDVVEADCATANITVNGVVRDDLGAIGNAWESFVLDLGENTLGSVCSTWAQRPDAYLIVREVWL